MARPLILGPALRPTCIVLQIVPVPGVGAIVAGAKNPHTRLLGHGVAQAALVVFGSYPLIIPGAVGLAWAIWDAVAISRAQEAPWTRPTPDAPPETLVASQKRAARDAARAAKKAEREARKAAKAAQKAERDLDR